MTRSASTTTVGSGTAAQFYDSVFALTGSDEQALALTKQRFGPPPAPPSAGLGRTAANVGLGALHGFLSNNLPNVAGALAGASPIPGSGEPELPFSESQARAAAMRGATRSRIAQGRQENPTLFTGGEVLGGIGQSFVLPGGGFVNGSRYMARLSKFAEKQGFLMGFLPRLAVGATEGAVAGSLAGAGEAAPGQAGRGALLGGALGAGAGGLFGALAQPLINGLMRSGSNALAKRVSAAADLAQNRPQGLAFDQLYHDITSGLGVASPDDLIPMIAAKTALIPDQAAWMALTDLFPDDLGLRRALVAASKSPGEAPAILERLFKSRTRGVTPEGAIERTLRPRNVTARLVNDINSLAGGPMDRAAAKRIAENVKRMEIGPIFDRVRADVTPVLSDDLATIAADPDIQLALVRGRASIQTEAAAAARDAPGFLAARRKAERPLRIDKVTGQLNEPLTVSDVYAISIGLEAMIKEAKDGSLAGNNVQKGASKAWRNLREWVDGIGAAVSDDYLEARRLYRIQSELQEAIDAGKRIGARTVGEVQDEMASFSTDAARNHYRLSFLEDVERRMRRAANPLSIMDSPDTKQRLAVLFADRPTELARLFENAVPAEVAMAEINPLMRPSLSGQQSAQAITRVEARSVAGGATGLRQPLLGQLFAAFTGVREQFTQEIELETAKALTATGRSLYDMLNKIRLTTPPNLTGARIMGQGIGSRSVMRQTPDSVFVPRTP